MRKAQKNQAEEFLKVLEEAHGQIRAMAEKKNVSAVLEILEDCQQGALSLGNMIETAEGEGCAVIPLLERYCELVWQFYEELSQGKALNGNKMHKLLRSFLLKIENSVRNDIKVRVEAVFLPYKASMWDSLESIWKAADADPDCDAYVIPIPYYDKNPDGSFREMHYEGSLYPADVPVMWYGNYDFEKRRPDMIYIHNPYDKYNYVTSVHPDFYSENLKRYTDNLIYVPYFMCGYYSSEESAQKHIPPCIQNIDYMVVQSKLHKKLMGINDYMNKKLLVLGNPKADRVLNMPDDLPVPQEWIDKSEDKFVILLNSTILRLLRVNDWAERTNHLLDLIESRNDLFLIWRPHPLLLSTVESMVPYKKNEFMEVYDRIAAMEYAVIDTNPTVDCALKYSDCLISTYSSIVMQYTLTGKPALLITGYSKYRDTRQVCFDFFSNYFMKDGVSFENFIEIVVEGNDYKKDMRIKNSRESIENSDGTCGLKIHKHMISEYLNLL